MAELNFRGIDLIRPLNRLAAGFAALAANVRSYLKNGFALRNPLSAAIATLTVQPHTIRRLNDSTPNGPPGGYAYIIGAGTNLYCWNQSMGVTPLLVATGLSGNPLSMIPFRPNASVQPWMYVGDSAPYPNVTLITKYLISGAAVNYPSNGMMKVRSDGLCYKMGIKEPQVAAIVSTANGVANFGGTGALAATSIPWTNYLSANAGFNYGETNGYPDPTTPDGTAPFIINCQNASTITITALANSGTVVINGATNPTLTTQSSTRVGAGAPGYPGQFIQLSGSAGHPTTASYIVGAFTDGNGNVVPAGVAPLYKPNIVDVGLAFASATAITVPYGAVAFQIGVCSVGNTYSANSGLITISGHVTTNALPTVLSILGTLAVSYWGDSPTNGPVGSYIWKNSGDPSGSGPVRTNTAANGSTSGNSFIMDATFTAGIPSTPGVGTEDVAMAWTTLNPDSVAVGSAPVFPAPLTTTYPNQTVYANFNWALTGNLYFPAAGNYTLVMTSHDDVIWGIQNLGGAITLVSATSSGTGEGGSVGISGSGQTLSVLNGYPLLPRQNYTSGEGGNFAQTTVVIHVAAAGIYGIEADFVYWYHSGRIFLIEGSPMPGGGPTIIPPLPASVRRNTQYRGVYRSTATGAQSNPGPATAPETIPVESNTVSMPWSDDPQVDVWDPYRIDFTTTDYTYVGTGPNDDLGAPGYNTPITDSLTDTQLGTQLLDEDNFEPFPSIDLPQKGTCTISGGVITWVSGGAIGGSATGWNKRWLPGTVILIGSPTSLPYIFIARPTSTSQVTIPGVPDGTAVAYQIPQPKLAAQPLAFLFGPTDNINITFGVGDPLRGGTLYWCNGSNLDSAADTNQQDVTDPSEVLVNGAMSGGRGVLFSIKRPWIIAPNFFNAEATALGTTGSQFSLKSTVIKRGLFMPWCICIEGGGNIYFRVDDGIEFSPAGTASKSITDETLYPLFPHEGSVPKTIVRNGVSIVPPDDTRPDIQKMVAVNGYVYFDYLGIDAQLHTWVWDIGAQAWIWDIYVPAVLCHAANEGESVQGCLVGCQDGTIRQFASTGSESVQGTVTTPAFGGRGWMHFYEHTVEYSSAAPVSLTYVPVDVNNGSYGPTSVLLPTTGGSPTKYTFKVSPNKWKWLQIQIQSDDPAMQVYLEGFAIEAKAWGSNGEYETMMPFATSGGEGAQP